MSLLSLSQKFLGLLESRNPYSASLGGFMHSDDCWDQRSRICLLFVFERLFIELASQFFNYGVLFLDLGIFLLQFLFNLLLVLLIGFLIFFDFLVLYFNLFWVQIFWWVSISKIQLCILFRNQILRGYHIILTYYFGGICMSKVNKNKKIWKKAECT